MRRLLSLLLPLLFLVTACSTSSTETAEPVPGAAVSIPPSNAEALASVKVEDLGEGKAPKVTFDMPLEIKAQSMRVVNPGDGAQIKDGQVIEFRQIALDTKTGQVLGETFTQESGDSLTLDESIKTELPLVYSTFVSSKVGSFISFTPAPDPAPTSAAPEQNAGAAAMIVFKVTSAKDAPPPGRILSSDEVATLAKDGKLPVATFDAKGIPSITIPKTAPLTNLAVQVLTEGKGDVLTATDSISALYTGWDWKMSKKFDSAYDRGEPISFSLQGVIKGWTLGLTGQKVGSTVLLTIPSAMAYGDNPPAGTPAGALVFVVKIEAKQ